MNIMSAYSRLRLILCLAQALWLADKELDLGMGHTPQT